MTDRYVVTQDDVIAVRVNESPSIDVTITDPAASPVVIIGSPQDLVSTVLTDPDGQKTVFALPQPARYPSQIQVFRNGLREILGIGFTATATTLTFTTAPLSTDVVAVIYERY